MAREGIWRAKVLVIQAVRRIWMMSPLRAEALAQARVFRGKYRCARCGKLFSRDLLEVHHKHYEMTKESYDDYMRYYFLGVKTYSPSTGLATLEDGSTRQLSELVAENLEALCHNCHYCIHTQARTSQTPEDHPKSKNKRRSS